MACFTKNQQCNGTNCKFEKYVTTSNYFVLNSLDKGHLSSVCTHYVCDKSENACVCAKWQWNALDWCYWIALPASPKILCDCLSHVTKWLPHSLQYCFIDIECTHSLSHCLGKKGETFHDIINLSCWVHLIDMECTHFLSQFWPERIIQCEYNEIPLIVLFKCHTISLFRLWNGVKL